MNSINNGYTLLRVIINKSVSNKIITDEIITLCETIVMVKARGTLVKDSWYQRYLPTINPEQEVVELMVPNKNINRVTDIIIEKGKLDRYGKGAIYTHSCEQTISKGPLIESSNSQPLTNKNMINGLTSIYCVVQKGNAEKIARVALNEGSHGPIISYALGKGIRDRLGLIRIAINPEKEFISVVVDDYIADKMFDAMITAGHLNVAGAGFIYMMPVDQGMINIRTVHRAGHSTEMLELLIKEMDNLKGSKRWRQVEIRTDESKYENREYLLDLVRLTCIAPRGQGEELVKKSLSKGAPGANIFHGVELGKEFLEFKKSSKHNLEKEVIEMTIQKDKVTDITQVMQSASEQDLLFYTQNVPKAFTYLG
ncbi:hypothetical protein DID75_01055 [Candidatus Marinamargulisbacteria bacterium SCGC AG-410-N11]|nr:hypothetical protein DID75_01055 [Candidatus Marinamargulisbacteria bacterium SCGC AG-410-N11]